MSHGSVQYSSDAFFYPTILLRYLKEKLDLAKQPVKFLDLFVISLVSHLQYSNLSLHRDFYF